MDFQPAINSILTSFILLIPGVLFRRFYFTGPYSTQFNQGNLFERFLWTSFWGASIVMVAIFSIVGIRSTGGEILSGVTYNNFCFLVESLEYGLPNWQELKPTLIGVIAFILFTYFLAYALGYSSYIFVTKLRLHVGEKENRLTFHNRWQYLASGELLPNKKKEFSDVLVTKGTIAEVLVQTNSGEVLYSGYLRRCFVDYRTDNIENLVLTKVFRVSGFLKNKKKRGEAEIIQGGVFSIDGARIINISFKYPTVMLEEWGKGRIYYSLVAFLFPLWVLGLFLIVSYSYESLYYFSSLFRKILFFSFCSALYFLLAIALAKTADLARLKKRQVRITDRTIIGLSIIFISPLVLMGLRISDFSLLGVIVLVVIATIGILQIIDWLKGR